MRAHASFQPASVALCVLVLLSPAGSSAVEYSAQPSISMQSAYDDNVLLTTQPDHSVSSGTINPQLDLAATMENWQVRSTGRLRGIWYSRDAGLNTYDKFFYVTSFLKQARSLWQLNGATIKESALLSETFSPDLGIVRTQTHRMTRSIAPAWSLFVTENTQFKLEYQSADANYDQNAGASLTDYLSHQTNLTLSNQITKKTQIFLTGGDSEFKAPTQEYRSTTSSWQLGLTNNFSDTVKANLSAGGRKTTSNHIIHCIILPSFPGFCIKLPFDLIDTNKDSGSLYNFSLQKQFERTRLSTTVNRGIDASGSVTQVQTDSVSIALNHDIMPTTLTASFIASGSRSQAVGGITANYPERDYSLFESQLSWRWAENTTIDGAYRRVRLKYTNIDAAAVSNSVHLTITYQAPGFRISR